MLSSQWELQYCRSSRHKNLFYISLFHTADTTVYSKVRPTHTSKKWPLHFSILENNQVCDLKCLCVLTWVLHCILYMYSPVSLRVPVSCDILYASIPYAQTHKLQDIKGLQPLTNNHDRHEKCTRQRSLWSGYQQTTDSDRIPTISALTCWKWR